MPTFDQPFKEVTDDILKIFEPCILMMIETPDLAFDNALMDAHLVSTFLRQVQIIVHLFLKRFGCYAVRVGKGNSEIKKVYHSRRG